MNSSSPDGQPRRRFVFVLVALLRQRCPRCLLGRMFRGLITMYDACPSCGLIFQREEGYFLGAMYVSYGLSVVLIGAAYWMLTAIWHDLSIPVTMALILLLYLPFVPAVFRYSRAIWIYFDRAICPSDSSAGAYEKHRIRHQPDRERP